MSRARDTANLGSTDLATQVELDALDLTPIRQDITILALREAVNTNSGDFNLPNSFIDDFHDATGSGTYTTTERVAGEYVRCNLVEENAQLTGSGDWRVPAGVTSVEVLVVAGGGSGFKSGNISSGGGGGGGIVYDTALTTIPATDIAYEVGLTADATPLFVTSYKGGGVQGNDSTFDSYTAKGGGVGAGYPSDVAFPTSTYAVAYFGGAVGGSGGGGAHSLQQTNLSNQATAGTSASGTITVYGNSGYGSSDEFSGGGGGAGGAAPTGNSRTGGAGQLFSNFTSYGVSGYFGGGGGGGLPTTLTNDAGTAQGPGGSGGGGAGGTVAGGSTAATNGTSGIAGTGGGGGGMAHPSGYSTANGPGSGGSGFIGLIWSVLGTSGNLIGNANVPSSAQTKVSGVLLYKDGGSGTTTLGTHLRVYFTCNGDADVSTVWTEVLAADMTVVSPFFSGTTKMVKLAEKTCTEGSDVRYKVEWASQSAGVIETQLHGIGLNY